jgi:hypothetical protein
MDGIHLIANIIINVGMREVATSIKQGKMIGHNIKVSWVRTG